MSLLLPGKETTDERSLVYARIESRTDESSPLLRRVSFGTLPAAYLDRDVVRTAMDADGGVELPDIDGQFQSDVRDAFSEQPLSSFVSDLHDRTPYAKTQAEVIVTRGWFEMSPRAAVQAINQHLREPYDDVSVEWVDEKTESAHRRHEEIQTARDYPFGL